MDRPFRIREDRRIEDSYGFQHAEPGYEKLLHVGNDDEENHSDRHGQQDQR